jgi:nucleoside-diphosphate-sugar epimerase
MRIFLTGATGFIGSHIILELLAAGHQVVGTTRSDAGAQALVAAGVEPYHATLEDPDSFKAGVAQADAVIHCAFDHDFANFLANCQKDQRVIKAMGEALVGTDKPFIITSGTGMGSGGSGQMAVESSFNANNPNPRAGSEVEGEKLAAQGVKVLVVRLPQVHDPRRQGLVSPLLDIARAKGASAYVGDGQNRWPAAHVKDVAQLYRLAVEQGRAGERFNAVDEEGILAKDIATALAKGLGLPAVSLTPEQAAEHFGWMGMFVGMDMPASSAWTRERLGWKPTGPGMIADLEAMDYAAA